MKNLPQKVGFIGNKTQQYFFFIENEHLIEKIQAPEVAAIIMQCGEIKLNL